MAPKARIAVVSPFIDRRHGTELCLAEQLERLARSYEIDLFSGSVRDLDLSEIRWQRVFVPPAPQLFSFLWWFAANSASRFWDRSIRGRRPDILYSPGINCFGADVIWVHIVFRHFRRQMGNRLSFSENPVSAWPRLIHRRLYYRLIGFLESRTYSRKGLEIVAPSREVADAIQRFYGGNANVSLVYHGVDTKRFRPAARAELRTESRRQLGFGDDEIVVLLIGNDWRKKGLPALIEAVSRASNPAMRILAVGTDDPAACIELARERNLSSRLGFAPPRADVEFYYAAADIYAGPSLEDAFALPPLEAMACGLPVITSRNAGVSELVHHGADGFVLEDPSDANALAELLARLADDPDLRKKIGGSAALTASQHTWDDNASRLNEIFQRVLLKRSAT